MLRVIKRLGRHVSHLLRGRFIRDCEANKRQIFLMLSLHQVIGGHMEK